MAQHSTNIGSVHHLDLLQTAGYPANTGHWPSVVLMLACHLQRRHNIKTTLPRCQCLVLAGYRTLLHTAKTKYLLILQVCRYCLLEVLWQARMRQRHQRKESIYFIYKWANTAFWQRYGRKSQLKSSKCLVYQVADIAFWYCTGRTDVNRTFAWKVKLRTWRFCLQAKKRIGLTCAFHIYLDQKYF